LVVHRFGRGDFGRGFLISKKVVVSAPVVRLVTRLKTAMSAQLQRRSFRSLALLGMLNGLLPCRPVAARTDGALNAVQPWMK
jgi:sulfite exporter TauE/SafE